MTTSTNDEIVKYVIRPENLPAALDIIKRADEIKRSALANFWDSVRSNVKTRMPKRLGNNETMDWEFDFWSKNNHPDASWRCLYYFDPSLRDAKQFLNYSLWHKIRRNSFEFGFGIEWNQQEPMSSHLRKLSAVTKLHQNLGESQFHHGPWWIAKAFLFEEDSVEAFLKKHAQSKKLIESKIVNSFLPFVGLTFEFVKKANKAIQKAR
jgi:hypothetical protein